MTRRISDDERRARLGHRHLLTLEHKETSAAGVARALTAIHGTDPTSTMLGILARSPNSTIANVEDAFYDSRTVVRVLGMRRTVFAVPFELAPSIWSAFDATVARDQRRLLLKMIAESGISNDENWLIEAEQRLLASLTARPGSTSAEIANDDPMLSVRIKLPGPGAPAATQSITSRLLTVMSAEGRVIRARPKGGWTSNQVTWAAIEDWRPDWPKRPDTESAENTIVRSWLRSYGPATDADLAWWTGWPKGRSRKAIDRVGGVEVQTNAGTAYVLDSDLETVARTAPWVALLPALDSSTMGWKQRDFYLGAHSTRLFDNVGNGGPTVWCDGRIVGGWAHHGTGEVRFELYEDVGKQAASDIEVHAARLESLLSEVRIKPRARRYTASELALL